MNTNTIQLQTTKIKIKHTSLNQDQRENRN